MLSDPKVIAVCDRCAAEDEFPMTPLVQRSWDLRNLDRDMARAGWRKTGEDEYLCPECCQDDEDDQQEQP